MKTLRHLALAAILTLGAASASAQSETTATPSATTDSLSQAVGTVLGNMIRGSLQNVQQLGVEVDNKIFTEALFKVINGESTPFTMESANEYIDSYIRANRPGSSVDTVSVESQDVFIAAAAAADGAITTPSGLVFQVLVEGEGQMPTLDNSVRLTYTGQLSDGTVFDQTDQPVVFSVKDLVPGFTEGLMLMRPGGKYRMVIPANLAYGANGIPGVIPGNSALDFTVNLIDVTE